MVERDVIPAEQYKRLEVNANDRGVVISARAPRTVIQWCIGEEILEPSAEVCFNIVASWLKEFGGYSCLVWGIEAGDIKTKHAAKLVKDVDRDLLTIFMAAGEMDVTPEFKKQAYNFAGELREAYRQIQKVIDTIDDEW